MIRKLKQLSLATAALGLVLVGTADAKVEGDTVYLGSAISLTGKYSTNGEHCLTSAPTEQISEIV